MLSVAPRVAEENKILMFSRVCVFMCLQVRGWVVGAGGDTRELLCGIWSCKCVDGGLHRLLA
jgi:hypothetical protein